MADIYGYGVTVGNNVTLGNGAILGGGATIGNNVTLGDGARLCYGATVGNNVTLGDGAILGGGAILGDKVKLGNNVTLGDKAKIGNEARLGYGAMIGHGATIGYGATIGHGATIGKQFTCEGVRVIKFFEMANLDGSGRNLNIYIHTKGVLIRAGCFMGNVDEFCSQAGQKHFYVAVVRAAVDAALKVVQTHNITGGWTEDVE
jgi:UDP-3-O-[3-hydroxymyristoyl] glucosamine N-acyltransferase